MLVPEYYPLQQSIGSISSSFLQVALEIRGAASLSRWQVGQQGRPNRASALLNILAIAKVVRAACGYGVPTALDCTGGRSGGKSRGGGIRRGVRSAGPRRCGERSEPLGRGQPLWPHNQIR